jgi:hypothetical protein
VLYRDWHQVLKRYQRLLKTSMPRKINRGFLWSDVGRGMSVSQSLHHSDS